ncbi:MAG: hypothetical protein JWP83_4983 [Mycobacterium sp.]|nr:hypothetical protein [Mycobacterium sp.]
MFTRSRLRAGRQPPLTRCTRWRDSPVRRESWSASAAPTGPSSQIEPATLWTRLRYPSGMEADRPPSDEVNAEPAHGAAAPWWFRGLIVVVIAAASATTYGGPLTVVILVVWIIFLVLLAAIGAASGWQRYMSLRRRSGTGLSFIVFIGMIAGWLVLAKVLERLLAPGTVVSYCAQFVSAAIIFWVGMTVIARMDPHAAHPPA